MLPQIKKLSLLVSITFVVSFNVSADQGPPPRYFNERFVIKAMASLHSAEATYQATTGSGSFGSLAQLRSAGLIDEAFASGSKYGYVFVVTPNQTSFTATATPARYKKSGLRSYYIDQRGTLFGNDKAGALANDSDVYIDTCALFGLDENERCTIQAMRTLHGAEATYAATTGNGNYCLIPQLYISGLIDMVLGTGFKHGYLYQVKLPSGPPPAFQIYSVPQTYGVTGKRSFFIDQTGVLRGADNGGHFADPTDPPIN